MSSRSASSRALGCFAAAALLSASSGSAYPLKPAAPAKEEPQPAAKFLPLPEDFTEPADQLIINDLLGKIANEQRVDQMLPALDQVLTKLRQPTRLRGLVQFWRAGFLLMDEKQPEAIEAVEESIRLLPGYSGPLITAASIYAYANEAGRGTDYFLRAAAIDPDTVRRVDDYEVNNLMRRLMFDRDERRVRALSDRLLEIGWIGKTVDSRSSLVRTAIEHRIDQGDVEGARKLVTKLLVPSHSYALLVERKFEAIWPDVETWGGPKLQTQWATYLREARERWAASKDVETVQGYLAALRSAGHERTIIRDILPLFAGKLDPVADADMQFVVSGVADALASEGRWDEIDRVFRRAQEVWPLRRDNPNSLNVAANWARFLLFSGKHQQALEKMDVAIEFARQWEVNPDAIGAMHHYRACALHALGRTSETGFSIGMASATAFPSDLSHLHLCTGNREKALRVLVDGLRSESSRSDVLSFVQKSTARSPASEYSRKLRAEIDRLKADPHLLAEVAKYGRILPFGPAEGAPPETAATP